MTLILSANVGNWCAIQVADRRLSQGSRRFNYANKQLMLRCEDAMVCLGFTGPARIADEPTDDWIARQLLRTDAQLTFNFGGPVLPSLKFHEAYYRMRSGLRAVASEALALTSRLDISLVGLRRVRNTSIAEPFWASMSATERSVSAWVSAKYIWFSRQTVRVDSFGSGAIEAQRYINRSLPRSGVSSVIEVEDFLVEVVRDVARKVPSVGDSAMVTTVNTDPTIDGDASIRFVPSPKPPPTADVYTPWVLAHGFTAPPSVTISGGAIFPVPGFKVNTSRSPSSSAGNVVLSVAPARRTPAGRLPPNQHLSAPEIIAAKRAEHLRSIHWRKTGPGS